MATQKTTRTDADVDAFIEALPDEARRGDARQLVELMQDATGEQPAMWGPSIIGFGSCVTDNGGTWMRLGFSPRARQTSVYILTKPEAWDDQLARLGTHTMGKGCLYVKRMSDIDADVLREMVTTGWAASKAAHPDSD